MKHQLQISHIRTTEETFSYFQDAQLDHHLIEFYGSGNNTNALNQTMFDLEVPDALEVIAKNPKLDVYIAEREQSANRYFIKLRDFSYADEPGRSEQEVKKELAYFYEKTIRALIDFARIESLLDAPLNLRFASCYANYVYPRLVDRMKIDPRLVDHCLQAKEIRKRSKKD